MSNKFDMTKK